jgi:hypothetical protein
MNIKDIKSRLEDAIFDMERAIDCIDDKEDKSQGVSETPVIDVENIKAWFSSPFVSEYDKQIAIKSYKREA